MKEKLVEARPASRASKLSSLIDRIISHPVFAYYTPYGPGVLALGLNPLGKGMVCRIRVESRPPAQTPAANDESSTDLTVSDAA
ncbi:MAG: hypothetical protein HKM98_07525 [Gammaproteobacteria bacterium]|nr:hypothetical protein [Gammaproteobacteria bacterium]